MNHKFTFFEQLLDFQWVSNEMLKAKLNNIIYGVFHTFFVTL